MLARTSLAWVRQVNMSDGNGASCEFDLVLGSDGAKCADLVSEVADLPRAVPEVLVGAAPEAASDVGGGRGEPPKLSAPHVGQNRPCNPVSSVPHMLQNLPPARPEGGPCGGTGEDNPPVGWVATRPGGARVGGEAPRAGTGSSPVRSLTGETGDGHRAAVPWDSGRPVAIEALSFCTPPPRCGVDGCDRAASSPSSSRILAEFRSASARAPSACCRSSSNCLRASPERF